MYLLRDEWEETCMATAYIQCNPTLTHVISLSLSLPLSLSDLESVFEAVGRGLVMPVSGLLSLLAEQQHLVVQEQVSLHGLEPGQVLHLKPSQRSATSCLSVSLVCLYVCTSLAVCLSFWSISLLVRLDVRF